MWIVARQRKPLKQALIRSHRTTSQRYFLWNQAKQCCCWKRGTELLMGLPRFFLLFQVRKGLLRPNTAFTQGCPFILVIITFVSSKNFNSFTRSARSISFDFCALHFWMPKFPLLEHHTNDILLLIYTAMCSVRDEMAHEAFCVNVRWASRREAYRSR